MLIDNIINYNYWNEEEEVYFFYNVIMKKSLDPFKKGDELELVILNFKSNSLFLYQKEFKKPFIYKVNFSFELE